MSKQYLHGHHASVLRSHSWRTVENSAPHLIPHLRDGSLKILDVGCGPGTISVDLATRVPQGFVYAIDPSAEVIEKARAHAKEKGVTNIRFEVGDVFDWKGNVDGEGFDITHAHQVLQHLQDPLGALKAMKRLTKPGGVVAVRDCDYTAFAWFPELPGMRTWSDIYVSVARGLGADPTIGKKLQAIARKAGFDRDDITLSCSTWVFSTPDEMAWWCGLWAERVVHSDFSKNALEMKLANEDDLNKIADTFRELEKAEDSCFWVPSGEIICQVR
jgi:ubiquinone/menaquinone biosynthesis C-methylase UbiE